VFTEYRDTLAVLVPALVRAGHTTAVLHGAQPEPERRAALDAFAGGRVGVLAATDTASEGLNLQARCRTVICFDVPWSPSRLAQRVGRVDRLGQARRVHALLLVAAGTGDEALIDRIVTRTGRIEAALDAADPAAAAGGEQAEDPTVFLQQLRRVFRRAKAFCAGAPHARRGAHPDAPCGDASHRTAITTLRVRSGAWTAGDGLLWLVSVRLSPEADTGARDLERHLVPVFLPWRTGPSRDNLAPEHPAWELLERHERDARACALASLAPRVEHVRRWVERRCATQRDRAEAIAADAAKRLAASLVQPGLFDRRGHEAGTPRTPAGAPAPGVPPLSQGEAAGLEVHAHVVAFARLVVPPSGSSHAELVSR
jgi:superfamily II DNA/RNA helicase